MRVVIFFCVLAYGTSSYAFGPFQNMSEKQFDKLCSDARSFNEHDNYPAAYKLFADQGDVYAASAEKIFDTKRVTMERCVIQAHWLNVVGKERKDQAFDDYGKYYQSTYINFVCDKKRLPNTFEIENLYGNALRVKKLPDALSIDKVLNRQGDTFFKKVQTISTRVIKWDSTIGSNWNDAIYLNEATGRTTTKQSKADISENEADNLAMLTSLRTIPVCAKLETKEKLHALANSALEVFHTVSNWVSPPKPDCLPKQH